MSQYKAELIKVPPVPGIQHTTPVEPEKRLPDSQIRIELCNESDAEKLAEGLYACYTEAAWTRMEPPSLRPSNATRHRLLAKRLSPSLTLPHTQWIKAVLVPSNQIVGLACWTTPGAPVHNYLRRSAIDFYDLRTKMSWSDAEIDEMWAHVDEEVWNGQAEGDDEVRRDIMGDEPHWYLAPLITWPEFRGRGVGKKLMNWAIEQADARDPPTAMYLESSQMARGMYMHCGFVPRGEKVMVRRGPLVVKGEEGTKEKIEGGGGAKEGEEKVVG